MLLPAFDRVSLSGRRMGRPLRCRLPIKRTSGVDNALLREDNLTKPILTLIGGLLILAGLIWVLQGINVLPGSFMTGQMRWALYGGLTIIAGAGLVLFARRRPTPPGD